MKRRKRIQIFPVKKGCFHSQADYHVGYRDRDGTDRSFGIRRGVEAAEKFAVEVASIKNKEFFYE